LHDVVQVEFTQAGCPLGSVVVQTLPPSGVEQPPQLVAVLVVSTHEPLQMTWLPVQPEAHVYICPSPDGVVQTGVPPSQLTPQAPQLSPVVSETQAPLQSVYPALHAKEQSPAEHAGAALARVVVHAVPHAPQLFGSLVVSTQLPLQTVEVLSGQVAMQA
jgi:hypothetical protein